MKVSRILVLDFILLNCTSVRFVMAEFSVLEYVTKVLRSPHVGEMEHRLRTRGTHHFGLDRRWPHVFRSSTRPLLQILGQPLIEARRRLAFAFGKPGFFDLYRWCEKAILMTSAVSDVFLTRFHCVTCLIPVLLERLSSLIVGSFWLGMGTFLDPTGALYRPDSLPEEAHRSLRQGMSVLRTSSWRLAQHLGGIILGEARLTAVHASVSLTIPH